MMLGCSKTVSQIKITSRCLNGNPFLFEIYRYAAAEAFSGVVPGPETLPALPSKTNGPAVLVGVMGPSVTSISVVGVRECARSMPSPSIKGSVGVIGLRYSIGSGEIAIPAVAFADTLRRSNILDGC